MPLCLRHINNIRRLLSPSRCHLWLVKQPRHLNAELFNQHVIKKSTGGSRLEYCKLSCWHMLVPKGLTANKAVCVLACESASCQFPVVLESVLHTARCKQLGEDAAKNIPQRAACIPHGIAEGVSVFVCVSADVSYSEFICLSRLRCPVGVHP